MGLHISFKHPFGKHSVLHQAGGVAKKLAPLAGLIPGVGPLAGLAMGGLGSLAHGDSLGDALVSGGMGYLGTKLGSSLTEGKGIGGLGDAFGKLGKFATRPDVLGNVVGKGEAPSLNFGKAASAALAGLQLYGQHKQNQSAQSYNNAVNANRNELLKSLLSGISPRYNFAPEAAATTPLGSQ